MITRHAKIMFAPDTATADAPAAMTPLGDVYKQALAEAQTTGDDPNDTPPVKVEAKPEKAAKKAEAAPKAAPKSAMDAALDGGEPDAKAEPVVEDDPTKDFGDTPKPGHWKIANDLIEKQRSELKELRGKAGKVEADPAILSELATIKAQLKERDTALSEREAKLAEYNDAMTAINLELHPDFRREFIDGRNELVQSAAAKLKSYGGNPEAIAEALAMPEGKRRDDAIEEVLGDLSESAKAKILRSVADIEALDERRGKAMKAPQQSFEELERKTLAQRQKQSAEAEQVKVAEFERVMRDLQKTGKFFGAADETLPDGKSFNIDLKQDIADAFQLFTPDAQFPDMAITAAKGKRYDRVVGMLTDRVAADGKELATLRAQLAQFDGAQPDIKGGKSPAKSAAAAALDKTPGQIYEETKAAFENRDDV